MILFKPYSNIKDFLLRFTIIKIGRLHIRIHKIVGNDSTTLMHNHPFHYLSIILKGGYLEQRLDENNKIIETKFGFLSFIFRNKNTFHRIDKVFGNTLTLFIAYGNYDWKAINLDYKEEPNGVFTRMINGKEVYAKREYGIWFIGNNDYKKAYNETRHSIHQVCQ